MGVPFLPHNLELHYLKVRFGDLDGTVSPALIVAFLRAEAITGQGCRVGLCSPVESMVLFPPCQGVGESFPISTTETFRSKVMLSRTRTRMTS